jgi:hypothetical protein
MDEFMTGALIVIGFFVLIGALILQWLHKWGFKFAKVETSQIPGFSKRFLIQIAAILVGYGVIYLVGKLFEVGVSNADSLALVSNITTAISSSIGNIYIAMLIMALIMSILFWVELLISGKLLVSYLTVKTHLVAAIPPVIVVLIVSALPSILGIVAVNNS